MPIDVGVKVIYESDTAKPRADWDAFIAYTQSHQPSWTANGGHPGPPGSGAGGPATASTFGGLSGIAPPPGTSFGAGAGFGGIAATASTAAMVAQASVLHQQAAQNAQDLVNRLAQASAVPPSVAGTSSPGGGGGGYRSWLAQELSGQSSDLGRANVLDNETRATRRLQAAFSPGSAGFEAYGRDADAHAARAERYRAGYSGLNGRGIVPYSGRRQWPSGWQAWGVQADDEEDQRESALARTHGGQRGPGAVGGGRRMWVPIGDTPEFTSPGYGAGRRARRAIPVGLADTIDTEEGDEQDTEDSQVNRGRLKRVKPLKPQALQWGKAIAAAWAIEHFASGVIGADNTYDISMAGATTLPQMLAAKSANIYSALDSVPLVGGLLGNLAESNLGWRQQLAGQTAQYGLQEGTFGIRVQQVNSQNSFQGSRLLQLGQTIGDPALVRQGIAYQSQVSSDNSYNDYQRDSYSRRYAIAELDAKANSNDDRWWYMGPPRRRGLTQEEQANRDSLSGQQNQATAAQNQQAGIIWQQSAQDLFANEYAVKQNITSTGYDIEARNRQTAASAFSGQLQPMTGSAMDEITADRLAVQQFNLSHPGDDYKDQRASNTASFIASQQQSFANLQFMGGVPGNAQQVSGLTSFGDFTNVGYKDYQNALAASGGGGNDIQAASNDSNSAAADMAMQLKLMNDILPSVLQAMQLLASWGSNPGVGN